MGKVTKPDAGGTKATPLPAGLAAPARRALAAVRLETLEDVAAYDRAELARLHGMGPRALGILDEALAREPEAHS